MSNIYVDDEKVKQRLNNIKNLDLYKSMMMATQLMFQTATEKASTGFKHSNGDLKSHIQMEVKEKADGIAGEVSCNSDHAIFVEFGTGTIGNGTYPYSSEETGVNLTYTDKPYWRYQDSDGNWHTTSGMVAHPFMFPAYKENEKKIKEIIGDDVHAVVSGNKYKGGK